MNKAYRLFVDSFGTLKVIEHDTYEIKMKYKFLAYLFTRFFELQNYSITTIRIIVLILGFIVTHLSVKTVDGSCFAKG